MRDGRVRVVEHSHNDVHSLRDDIFIGWQHDDVGVMTTTLSTVNSATWPRISGQTGGSAR
jgi:hypothetical protein